MSVYSYIVALLVACVSYVVYQRYASVYSSIIVKPNKRYDFIIGKYTEIEYLLGNCFVPLRSLFLIEIISNYNALLFLLLPVYSYTVNFD